MGVLQFQSLSISFSDLDQKLRLRNFDARHGRIETGAVVKNRKGMSSVDGGKGTLLPVARKRPVFEGREVQFLA